MKKKVEILLPCYNEEKSLEDCIKKIKKVIEKDKNYNYKIIVCDNNSIDKSRKIAKKQNVTTLIEKKLGYGSTLLNGINKSKADYIVMLDSDLSYNEKHIPKFTKELEKYDLVMGNRFKGKIEKNSMPISHRIGSSLLTLYANILFNTPSKDFHCGLRAFNRKKIQECNLSSPGFEFASEMIIKAKLNNLKIKEIPTDLFCDKKDRIPHLKTIKDGIRHFKLITNLFLNNLSKKQITVILLSLFFILYLITLLFSSNYKKDNNIPTVDIRLNKNTSLNEIHNNSKHKKYKNNTMTLNNKKYNIEIKGRGNYTWILNKRPYQITFKEKTSILGLPKAKKYVLLANYLDPSLLKNDFTYEVAKELNLNYSRTGKYIDLYIDKKYLGNYYVIPKVSINKAYVDLKDDNAILMELDNLYYKDEEQYFKTNTFKDFLTIKDTQSDNYQESYETFKNKYNLMEEKIINKDYNWLKDNIEIESFIKYYIISDFSKNPDSLKSSLYFYMDGKDDKIHVGPIWDFDLGYGLLLKETNNSILDNKLITNTKPTVLFDRLIEIEEFRNDVESFWKKDACKIYNKEINKIGKKTKYLQKSGEENSQFWNKKHYNEYTKEFKNWVNKRYKYYNNTYGCENNE